MSLGSNSAKHYLKNKVSFLYDDSRIFKKKIMRETHEKKSEVSTRYNYSKNVFNVAQDTKPPTLFTPDLQNILFFVVLSEGYEKKK